MGNKSRKGRTNKNKRRSGRASKPSVPHGKSNVDAKLESLPEEIDSPLRLIIGYLNDCEDANEAEVMIFELADLFTAERFANFSAEAITKELKEFVNLGGITTIVETSLRWGRTRYHCADKFVFFVDRFCCYAPAFVPKLVEDGCGESLVFLSENENVQERFLAATAVKFFSIAVKLSPKVATSEWTEFVEQAVRNYPDSQPIQVYGKQYFRSITEHDK
eukprot:scaffold8535_cov132-Cylindrotheca_fusiformis.AAC.2